MRTSGRRTRVLVVVGFLLAAVVAGMAGHYLEQVTGQSWVRYLPVGLVIVAAVAAIVRSGLLPPKE